MSYIESTTDRYLSEQIRQLIGGIYSLHNKKQTKFWRHHLEKEKEFARLPVTVSNFLDWYFLPNSRVQCS
jgi:hypothetical protein